MTSDTYSKIGVFFGAIGAIAGVGALIIALIALPPNCLTTAEIRKGDRQFDVNATLITERCFTYFGTSTNRVNDFWFPIKVDHPGTIHLALTGSNEDFFLWVFEENGDSTNNGDAPTGSPIKTLWHDVPPGVHWLRAQPDSGHSGFKLDYQFARSRH